MQFFSTAILSLAIMAVTVTAAPANLQRRAAPTAQVFEAQLQNITKMVDALTPTVAAITPVSENNTRPFDASANGLRALNNVISGDTNDVADATALSAASAQPVCTAFRKYIKQSLVLLNNFIAKSGNGGDEDYVKTPAYSALNSFQSANDFYLQYVAVAVQASCEAIERQDQNVLDKKIQDAMCQYTPEGTLC